MLTQLEGILTIDFLDGQFIWIWVIILGIIAWGDYYGIQYSQVFRYSGI